MRQEFVEVITHHVLANSIAAKIEREWLELHHARVLARAEQNGKKH